MGGLGNQLFQIFTTISCALSNNHSFGFINVEVLGHGNVTIRYTYWKTLLRELQPFLMANYKQPIHVIKEIGFNHSKIPINNINNTNNTNINIMLNGYFQSYRYFEENYYRIYKFLKLNTLKQELMDRIGKNIIQFENTISMHFRMGDYKKLPHIHPVMSETYYVNALHHIQSFVIKENPVKFTVLYFCEEEDITEVNRIIKNLKNKLPQFDFTRGAPLLADWEQMIFMSMCHHNIIANSTFSWWAAYLNTWKDKTVCYPSLWFGPSMPHDIKDLCPIEWTKINANYTDRKEK
jgi:dimeric dUTPase (all-alpha-NTP-PPase superfamily)